MNLQLRCVRNTLSQCMHTVVMVSRRNTYSHTDTDDEVHKINKGYALVIHNKDFETNLSTREGSEHDLNAIKSFCRQVGLKIDIKENLKVDEIRSHCRKLVADVKTFSSCDGFLCFILSHGQG